MPFLVYLMVLMAAISTVLLEVHWLTSPAPQPKPTVQAGAPPPPKVEGPNAALSPIYPKKLDAPQPSESNSQAQTAPASTPQTTGQAEPAPAAPTAQNGQQPATAQTTQPQQPAAAPQSRPKNSAETTGAAVREDNTREVAANPANASNRNDNLQQTAQGSSRNRCDILACAGAYRSFRANDCTYQPFDGGPRRLCEKSPGQRMAREQPDRRRWGGDAQARYLDRPTSGRRFVDEDDDVAADFDYARREPLGFFIFGRRPRW
jgi:hypothetical protein